MISILNQIIKESKNDIFICKNKEDINDCINKNKIGIILHIEGAEAISENFDSLNILYSLGLRSIGLVWSRPNKYGYGVPFKFPSSPDIGPGLTDKGKQLIKKCNELNVLIDLSHLNEKGFWDVAKISSKPLIATHSNVHEICPHSRNLTNKQLQAIKESDGIVGLNFAPAFLRVDGKMEKDTPLEIIIKHFDHLINILGEDRVAIGSDFDGATIPMKIKNLSGMINLQEFLLYSGYDKNIIEKLFYKNWLNFLVKNL